MKQYKAQLNYNFDNTVTKKDLFNDLIKQIQDFLNFNNFNDIAEISYSWNTNFKHVSHIEIGFFVHNLDIEITFDNKSKVKLISREKLMVKSKHEYYIDLNSDVYDLYETLKTLLVKDCYRIETTI